MRITSKKIEMVIELRRRQTRVSLVLLAGVILTIAPISACRKSVQTAKGAESRSAKPMLAVKGPALTKEEQSCSAFV